MDLADIRREYQAAGLDVADVRADPLDQLRAWLELVREHEDEPSAVVLATADADGRPSARTVLVKGIDERGLVIYTSYESRKGRELAANPHACLLFTWPRFGRQVSITGPAERVSAEESDAYFASRPRGSQLGAWASEQSAVLPDRAALDARYAAMEAEHAGSEVPRPPRWGGFLLRPEEVELWQGRPNRLHDRLRYRRSGSGWVIDRLSP